MEQSPIFTPPPPGWKTSIISALYEFSLKNLFSNFFLVCSFLSLSLSAFIYFRSVQLYNTKGGYKVQRKVKMKEKKVYFLTLFVLLFLLLTPPSLYLKGLYYMLGQPYKSWFVGQQSSKNTIHVFSTSPEAL